MTMFLIAASQSQSSRRRAPQAHPVILAVLRKSTISRSEITECQRSPVREVALVIEEEKGPEASHVQTVETMNVEKGIGRKRA